MDALTPLEERRVYLQAELDAAKTPEERNRLGQFATPTGLASDVLAYARRLLPKDSRVRFLDPAIGTGSFYAALLREFPTERIEAACGIEIDPHYGKPARALWAGSPLEITLGDFTTMPPPGKGRGFNLLICNPPYVRHHHMDKAAKARLLAATTTATASGIKLGGLAGLYCYFLGLSHAWMAPDGIAGWLIPSEFMDVNYGEPVKRYLLKQVELIRIHRFDPSELQFGDALVSSAVVWFRKRKPVAGQQIEFSYGGTLAAPKISRMVPAATLHSSAKWTSLAADGVRPISEARRLSDFFSIKRGLATGDNSFFIMTRDQLAARGLPLEFFKPILPSPRYLETDIIEAEADGTPKIERQNFILDCRLQEAAVKMRHPALWAYLQTGKPKVAETYLCSRRTPWYAQENRPAAPFVCTYMGRSMTTREKPFRFILNRSQATAANVYLLLYPKPALAKALAQTPDLAARVWKFLDGIDAATLLGEGRVYGGGLYKMEPKELANVPAEAIAAMLPNGEDRPAAQGEMFTTRAA
jgi:predicted RNA methylase